MRLKNATLIIMGQSPASEDYSPFTGESPFLQGNAEFGERHPRPRYSCSTAVKSARIGDLLFSVRAPVGALNEADAEYGIGRGLCAIRPRLFTNRFAWYVLQEVRHEVQQVAQGSTFEAVTTSEIGNMRVDVPPLEEQGAIVRFLDKETSNIGALIARKQQLVRLLEEEAAALRESLFAPAPIVPPGWRRFRNKALFREVEDRAGVNGAYELLTVSHLTGVTPRSEKSVNMFLAESFDDYKVCRRGDVVLNTMWAWAGAAGVSPTDGIVSPSYAVYRSRLDAAIEPRYFDYFLRSPGHIASMAAHSEGVWRSRLRLYPEVFLSMDTTLPDMGEQRRIANQLDNELSGSSALKSKLGESINTLREYRSALITAAVTGQIDVRKAA